MPWHYFKVGQSYTPQEVVEACQERCDSSKVQNPEEKRSRYLPVIEKCGFNVIVWSPIGTGWGASPMNPHCWRSPAGRALG